MDARAKPMIDVNKIPPSTAEALGWAGLRFVMELLGSEEGRAMIEAEKRRMKGGEA